MMESIYLEHLKQNETIQTQEEAHLEHILSIARSELTGIRQSMERMEEEMQAEKREARENITYGIRDMTSPDDFEAFVELSQSMSHVDKMVSDYDEYKKRIAMLRELIQTPYFARIDFQFDDGFTEAIYIGRRSLSDKVTKDICIYDWRAPIASVFYRFMTGSAYYDAPCGRIDGQLLLKRQFEIRDSTLQYFFDSDLNINDEILRQLLSQNTSPKMKAIVETIQADQDIIIRDMENDLLMVQGVAGSGKTSIALHRAAYLLYQGVQSGLTADSILVLSPNSTFEDYIDSVLPELGEENVTTVVFETLLHDLLRDRSLQSHFDCLEQAMIDSKGQSIALTGFRLKTSEHFLELLHSYIENYADYGIEYRDIYYHGTCIITKKQLKERLKRRPEVSLGTRLKQLQTYVLELAFGTGKRRAPAEEIAAFLQMLQEFLTPDIFTLYRSFFASESIYEELLTEVGGAEVLDAVIQSTMEGISVGPIPYEDAMALAYLSLHFSEKGIRRHIRQVVINEAQDYYPIQFEIIRILFPNARFTVLGDINQTLARQENMRFYREVKKRLRKEKASLVNLTKSFRCTNEILKYGLRFLDHAIELESFNRTGEEPKLTVAATKEQLAGHIFHEIAHCVAAGYGSVCLICKSAKNVTAVQESLKAYLARSEDTSLPGLLPKVILDYTGDALTGVLSLPVYLSKGLEFDAVLICDADSTTYHTEDDRKLLYISCTRALHHLSLFCEGDESPLVQYIERQTK